MVKIFLIYNTINLRFDTILKVMLRIEASQMEY